MGSNKFYEDLKDLSIEERKLFSMRSILEINQLYGDEKKKRTELSNARFINTCIKATLLGAIASDSLKNGQTISGIGGQYNFVAMAHDLENARSIMICRSVYNNKTKLESNIVFNYSNISIPRHLRDIVITEYGIADIRGKTDEEVIKAMLNIADSRFQEKLLREAKLSKKINRDYRIPIKFKTNYPEFLKSKLKSYQKQGFFSEFPFGSELSAEEVKILKIFKKIKSKTNINKIGLFTKGLFVSPSKKEIKLLNRMNLVNPKSTKEYLFKFLLLGANKKYNK